MLTKFVGSNRTALVRAMQAVTLPAKRLSAKLEAVMLNHKVTFPALLSIVVSAQSFAAPQPSEGLEAPAHWTAAGSDGVRASVSADDSGDAGSLRVDFDFQRGSGFVTFRREVNIDLPANWRFDFDVRGECPSNNFEFKLIDETGDNVWWVNQRAYEFPREWTHESLKKRHFEFAWGPGGSGKPLTKIRAIELAVAAGSGGKGSLWIDSLRFAEIPPSAAPGPVSISVSSAAQGAAPPATLPEDGALAWRSDASDAAPTIELSFGASREFGGLTTEWGEDFASAYDVDVRNSAGEWRTLARVRNGNGASDHLPLPECEGMGARVRVITASGRSGVELARLRVRGLEYSSTQNDFLRAVAAESPRGFLPRAFLGEQSYWTIVGSPASEDEALLSEDGALELGKAGPTIEPFLLIDGRVWSWADAEITHELADGASPLPMVRWETENLLVEIQAFVPPGEDSGTVRGLVTVRNKRHFPARGFLALTLRALQAMPMTQNLNMTGGAARVRSIEVQDGAFNADGRVIRFTEKPWAIGAMSSESGEIVEMLDFGEAPEEPTARDPEGRASGAAVFQFDIPARNLRRVGFEAGMRPDAKPSPIAPTLEAIDTSLAAAREWWSRALSRPEFRLPGSAQKYAETFRSQVAFILINRDGAAIQPGSRSYDRTWIRDGALTSTALLYAGHADAVREFIDWFAPFQYENGKVPCCADERGPDPVPEHDSHGQYIYAVAEYDRFMHDDGFVRAHAERVARAVEYIASLRAQRMTTQFKDAEGLERAKYGLVPESISHEGYSAKPMHSYWDDFWILRGLEDAAYVGARAGDEALAARASADADSMRKCLYDSMRRAIAIKNIDYIPGCVELGDFDATSTSIGIFPVGELGNIPEPQLRNTFDRYARWFDDRAQGRLEWRDYTPYEIRNTTTFLFLNRRDVTHRMMEFFFKDQRPAGWSAWAEVVRNGYRTPGFIGDLPHTWVGSDFVKLLRTMFVHERAGDGALVVGMGITREWMQAEGGASAIGLATHYGSLDLSFFSREGARVVKLSDDLRAPSGGVEIALEQLRGAQITADGKATALNDAGRLILPWPVSEVVIQGGE